MQIIDGILARTELTMNAMGGSELMMTRLYESLDKELFKGYQIINSRIDQYAGLRADLHRILILHDLPGDPASEHLANGGHRKFHKLVFVSNWQMQQYIAYYNIPWSKCIVMKNSIVPIDQHEKPKDIALGYWTTPHRGLSILVPVFEKLQEKYPDLRLEVFSSFKIYGWDHRDNDFKEIFDRAKDNSSITLHGSVSNESLREALKGIHILAYPSIWPETSCLTLMEAMSAKCLAVHPNYAALYETSSGFTHMYQMQDQLHEHADVFMRTLEIAIDSYYDEDNECRLNSAKSYADFIYNHDKRMDEWKALLSSPVIKNMPIGFESEILTIKGS